MQTAQIIGLETEYAAWLDNGAVFDPLSLFEGWTPPFRARWDAQPERPWCDARGFVPAAGVSNAPESPLELLATPNPAPESVARSQQPTPQIGIEDLPSVMLTNGARFYLDHTHPEWSTPECASPLEAVLYDKAGELWLNDLVERINAQRKDQSRLALYKNNVDVHGNTYGSHENYLVDAMLYENLFEKSAHRFYTVLIPFLVTRQILCGAGKVALLDTTGEFGFHISQRADFFETILGLQTTHHRPLINTRDEPHADASRFRRLHVITGDSNLAEHTSLLKIGATALVLEMLGHDCIRLDLTLADPLRAVRVISQDPTCRQTIELETGKRRCTAVDIQRAFVQAAKDYLDAQDDHTYRREIWTLWASTVEDLATDPTRLATRIDWVIKYEFLKAQIQLRDWTWATPQIRELDIKYHQINPQRSLFYRLQSQGAIERLLEDAAIRQACVRPPATTRARLRVACLERYRDYLLAVNWNTMVFSGSKERIWRWRWDDPMDKGDAQTESILRQASDPETFVRLMLQINLRQGEK